MSTDKIFSFLFSWPQLYTQNFPSHGNDNAESLTPPTGELLKIFNKDNCMSSFSIIFIFSRNLSISPNISNILTYMVPNILLHFVAILVTFLFLIFMRLPFFSLSFPSLFTDLTLVFANPLHRSLAYNFISFYTYFCISFSPLPLNWFCSLLNFISYGPILALNLITYLLYKV